MRKIGQLIVILTMVLSMSSCVESSGKYKSLVAQNDSLQIENQSIETSYYETLELLNQIETGFQEIRASEGKMMVDLESVEDGSNSSLKEHIAADINSMKEILAENKAKIRKLQSQINKSGKENTTLAKTIARLEKEMTEKDNAVISLQNELSKKNIIIDDLNAKVSDLNSNVARLTEQTVQQQELIKSQTDLSNEVYYCVATQKELTDANIVKKTGIFRQGELMKGDYDMEAFHKQDLREFNNLYLDAKKVKILSNHPESSYRIEKNEDNMLTLSIIDVENFWGITKYLVVKKIK